MTTDERMEVASRWFRLREGLMPGDVGTAWWDMLGVILNNIGCTYGLDYLWWVATGERLHGMADLRVPDADYAARTYDEFHRIGAQLPPALPTVWE